MNARMPLPPPLQTELLTTAAQIEAIKPEWHDLSVTSARATCFSSPSYFQAWCDTASDDVTWSVLIARRAGTLIGVVPLMRATVRRGPSCAPRHDFAPSDLAYLGNKSLRPFRLHQISSVVSIPCTLVGPAPLCAKENIDSVLAEVTDHLSSLRGWDTFAVPTDIKTGQEPWKTVLDHAGFTPWVLELGRTISGIEGLASFADIVACQNGKFRQNIRRAERKAEQTGMSIRLWEGAESVRVKLPAIAEVANQSWKANDTNQGLHIPYKGVQQVFIEALINTPNLDDDLTPVLAEAHIDGQPVAVLLSLRHGDRLTALITFHNDQSAVASPGLLMFGRMIDWAYERNLAGFDFNISQNWARHLTNHSTQQNIVVCYANTLRGRFFAGISRWARRHHKAKP